MAFADEAPICTSSMKLRFLTGVSSSRSDLYVPIMLVGRLLSFKAYLVFVSFDHAACQATSRQA